jgi:hypothetical protein
MFASADGGMVELWARAAVVARTAARRAVEARRLFMDISVSCGLVPGPRSNGGVAVRGPRSPEKRTAALNIWHAVEHHGVLPLPDLVRYRPD